jgi:probable phosphomutase (TIGR03848 family)
MATVLLVRHGRTAANVAGILAGRAEGLGLDETGQGQAVKTAERLAVLSLADVVSSPLQRCRETSALILGHQENPPPLLVDERLTECDYGEWQGRSLGELAKEPLWSVVQSTPSQAVFPGGESMAGMQARAVGAIREHDARVGAEHGPGAIWVAVSHGDVIKSILADALGMRLDLFQRIGVSPASVSIVRYGAGRSDVVAMNTVAGDLSGLTTAPPADAPVGGGAE